MSTAGSDFNRANERLRRPAPPFLCARRAHRLDAGIDGVIINMPTNIQGNRPEAARRR
jgi:hypothetical protein